MLVEQWDTAGQFRYEYKYLTAEWIQKKVCVCVCVCVSLCLFVWVADWLFVLVCTVYSSVHFLLTNCTFSYQQSWLTDPHKKNSVKVLWLFHSFPTHTIWYIFKWTVRVFQPLKALYILHYRRHSPHAFTHSIIHWWGRLPCKVPTTSSGGNLGAIWGSVACLRPLRRADWRSWGSNRRPSD